MKVDTAATVFLVLDERDVPLTHGRTLAVFTTVEAAESFAADAGLLREGGPVLDAVAESWRGVLRGCRRLGLDEVTVDPEVVCLPGAAQPLVVLRVQDLEAVIGGK